MCRCWGFQDEPRRKFSKINHRRNNYYCCGIPTRTILRTIHAKCSSNATGRLILCCQVLVQNSVCCSKLDAEGARQPQAFTGSSHSFQLQLPLLGYRTLDTRVGRALQQHSKERGVGGIPFYTLLAPQSRLGDKPLRI